MADPFTDALAAQPERVSDADPFATALAAVAPPAGLMGRAWDLISSLPDLPGIRHTFRALRAPQQALVTGPALAFAEAAVTRTPVTPAKVLRASLRAVHDDASLRDAARLAGLPHATIAGTVGDLVLDPLWILTPAKLVRAIGLVALAKSQPVQRAVAAVQATRPVQALGKAFVYRFGQPAAYAERAEEMTRQVQQAVADATALGQAIAKLPAIEQRAVRSYMIAGSDDARDAALAAARAEGLNAERIGELGAKAIERDVDLGKELVDVGLMSEAIFQRWRGKHLRREFARHENPTAYLTRLAARDPERAAKLEAALKAKSGWVGVGTPLRERLAFLKARKDLPAEWLRDAEEILEAAHPVAKGQALAGRAVAMRRFLRDVADQFGSKTRQLGYQYVGDAPVLGPLQKLYLPEAIAEDVNRVVTRPNEAWRLWRQGVGWWKFGKVVLNPATWARNTISNFMLADLAGLAPFKVHRYAQGLRSLVTRDRWYQEAKAVSTFLTDTFAGRELPRLLEPIEDAGTLTRLFTTAARGLQNAGKGYQANEQLFKMAFFIDRRMAGDAPKLAAEAADRALFNYRKVPQFIDTLRTYGLVPFVTFPYKALPATARALAERPAAVSRYGQIMRTFEAKESEAERRVLPKHMRDAWMRLPGTDADGRVRHVNLQYILPFGDIGELTTGGGFLGRGGAKPGFLSAPLWDVGAALISGRDPFTDQEIAKQVGGWRAWLTNFLLPPLAGGYASRELVATLQGRPVNILSREAEPRTLPQTLAANLAGLRIRPIDIGAERVRRIREVAWEINEVQAELRRWQRSPHVTREERDEAMADALGRIRELVGQIGELQGLQLPAPLDRTTPPASRVSDLFGEALAGAAERSR